jgi:hypothetical protein
MDIDPNDLNLINNIFNIIHINISVFIFILNSLILYVIINKLKLDNIELKFVFLFCVVEIVVGLEYTSVAVCKLVFGYTFFASNNTPCIFFGYSSSTFVRFELVVVSLLALWRYLAVVHEYKLGLKLLVVIIMMGISPTLAMYLYGLINMDARPLSSYIVCAPLTTPGRISTILNNLGTVFLMLPCWITTYYYLFIGWKANKKLSLMKIEAQVNNNEDAIRAIEMQRIHLIL